MNYRKLHAAFLIAATMTAITFGAIKPLLAAQTDIGTLLKETDFHGISVDLNDSSRIYLATHHGLYVVSPNGDADRVSDMRADFMGFTPHPSKANILYASGHPSNGGNLGIIVSNDSGKSWKKISDGIGGPVDFHQMTVSRANPDIVIGNSRGLQVSKDGGWTWRMVAPAPKGTIDLTASANDENTIYAATQSGIVASSDGGISWGRAHSTDSPATMIEAAADGQIYAFIIGTGLIRATEPGLDWQLVSNDFGGEFVLHLAVDGTNAQNIYAITFDQKSRKLSIIASNDGGEKWKKFGK